MASEAVRDGCFAINKPKGMSSAQVVRACQDSFSTSEFFKPLINEQKKKLNDHSAGQKFRHRRAKIADKVKIGHGGTLDPLATGVLIMGIGSATKSLNQFLHCVKVYETTMVFGASTDTYDRVGRVLTRRPYEHITKEKVQEKLKGMLGTQLQVPPLYSALKMEGKPLYEYAREGKPIPREIVGREIEIKDIELLEWYEPGTHNHRWPTEEASEAERSLAEQVWKLKKHQDESGKLTPEERAEEDQAIAAHESFKRKFEERQDRLVSDSPTPSKRARQSSGAHVMSGALPEPEEAEDQKEKKEEAGEEPEDPTKGMSKKQLKKLQKKEKQKYKANWKDDESKHRTDLVPEVPVDTPPPWDGKGPPACRIRIMASSGFYVRSFCNDLGQALDSVALMSELVRVRQSDFAVGEPNCLELSEIQAEESQWAGKMANALARWNGEPTPDEEQIHVKEEPSKSAPRSPRHSSPVRSGPASPKRQVNYHSVSPQKRKTQPSRSPSPAAKVRRGSATSESSWTGIAD